MSDELQQNVPGESPKAETPVQETVAPQTAPVSVETPKADSADIAENKILAVVGYLIPLLFFVPMLAEKKSLFAMFHANQQLSLLIATIIIHLVGTFIPILGWFVILPLGLLAMIVIAIIGAVRAANGEMRPLPLIGGFSIIK